MSFLVVGGGSIGERHLRCARKAGVTQLGLIEPKDDRRNDLTRKYDLASCWSSLDAADLSRFSHSIVASPPRFHFDHTRRLAQSRLHVLCEKPLAASRQDLEKFMTLDPGCEPLIRIAYTRRSLPVFRTIHHRLQSGQMGDLKLFSITGGAHFPTARPDYLRIYWADPQQGGCSLDAISHYVDLAQWYMGSLEYAGGTAANLETPEAAVDDSAMLLLRGSGNRQACIQTNQFQPVNRSIFLWANRTECIQLEMPSMRLEIWDRRHPEGTCETVSYDFDNAYVEQVRLFIEETHGNGQGLTTIEEAAENLDICLQLRETFHGQQRHKATHDAP